MNRPFCTIFSRRLLRCHLVTLLLSAKAFSITKPATRQLLSQLQAAATNTMKGSVYICTSLDGFIADPDGSTSFLDELPPPEDGSDMGFSEFLNSVDVIIMGRNTFDKVLSFGQEMWPYGDTQMVVWSRSTMEIPDYRRSTVSCSNLSPTELFHKLESEGKTRAYIDGGITVQKFLAAGLITDLCLSRAPVLLGTGIPLFGGEDAQKTKLKHLETTAHPNGVVSSKYEVISEDDKEE